MDITRRQVVEHGMSPPRVLKAKSTVSSILYSTVTLTFWSKNVTRSSLSHSASLMFFFWYSAVPTAGIITPITWQAAVDDEEQQPLLEDILEAAVADRRQAAVDVEEQRPQLQDIFERSHRWESCLGKIAEVVSRCLPRGFYLRVSFSWIVPS